MRAYYNNLHGVRNFLFNVCMNSLVLGSKGRRDLYYLKVGKMCTAISDRNFINVFPAFSYNYEIELRVNIFLPRYANERKLAQLYILLQRNRFMSYLLLVIVKAGKLL